MDFDAIKDKVDDFAYAIKSDPKKKKIAIVVIILAVGCLLYFTK